MSTYSVDAPFLRHIDTVFAAFIYERTNSELVANCAALVSYLLSEGHICLDLSKHCGTLFSVEEEDTGIALPELEETLTELRNSPWVVNAGEQGPLVLDGTRLYLQKYHRYQQTIASIITKKLLLPPIVCSDALLNLASTLFHKPDPGDLSAYGGHLQFAAGLIPLFAGFSVISGGPGTGKTTVLAKVLTLLMSAHPDLSVALAAPTGKAAMRMNESLLGALHSLEITAELKEKMEQLEALTVHRLLGTKKLSPHFQHNNKRPLNCDLLVVDEASMIDVALMAKLLSALKPQCRVVLLGDMNQLSSVEAGSVLGDICAAYGVNRLTEQFCNTINPHIQNRANILTSTAVLSPVIHLRRSYRFGPDSGIGRISRAIIDGTNPLAAWEENSSDCLLQSCGNIEDYVTKSLAHKYAALTQATTPMEALDALDRFKIVTVTKVGPWGAQRVNELLSSAQVVKGEQWYHNMPIMVLENSYSLELFNGDTGVIQRDATGKYKAYFRGDAGIRSFLPALLPSYTLAYAITVHKSQGSEFDEVVTLLPDKDSLLLTKELVYTAITRAKKSALTIVGDRDLLQEWLQRRVVRGSGLTDLLKL